jgi:hypothetical protein
MSWNPRKVIFLVILLAGGLLSSGCAAPSQYKSPYAQEESSQTYRELYPRPFTLDQGPSATSSGDE